MTHRELPQDSNFIADHMFSTCHQSFADDLGSIVFPRADMHGF
jgi:hypothetical protein